MSKKIVNVKNANWNIYYSNILINFFINTLSNTEFAFIYFIMQ